MNGKRILIIEDHPASADSLKAMIERRGGLVDLAITLEEAEVVVRAHAEENSPIDLIVSDLCLPSSIPLATIIRLQNMKIPFLLLSGLSTPEIVEACVKANARLVLKGTAPEGIMEAIYYTLAKAYPGYLKRAAKEIIRNRQVVREIPAYSAAWFFANWPRWVRVTAAVGTVLATLTATATLGGTIYGWVNDRAAAPVIALQHVKEVDKDLDNIKAEVHQHTVDIAQGHDDRIKIFERIGGLEKKIDETKVDMKNQLDRIESKLDRR